MPLHQPLSQTPTSVNYRRLFVLRNFAIAGQILAIAWVHHGLGITLPLAAMASIVGLEIVFNGLTAWRLARPWPVSEREFFAQLLGDVIALTALVLLSGGPANPFISLYLVPLFIAATALPRAYTWAMAAITAGCYSLLTFYAVPWHHDAESGFSLHLLGMWLNFVLSAGLIAFFIVRIAATLRERERMLVEVREDNLRNEQVVALGAMAAGAAHELSTPLTTMAVITEDMERECAPEFADDVRCLREQIAICKRSLTRLLAHSGHAREEATAAHLSLESFLNDTLEQWRLMRPAVPLTAHWAGIEPAPQVSAEPTLSQTLMNLLNNAADASPVGVELEGSWDEHQLTIEIRDHGPGITPEVAKRAAEPFFTTKAPGHGFGLGLFLANATVERFGGKVRLFNHAAGGACTRITLPLSRLARAG